MIQIEQWAAVQTDASSREHLQSEKTTTAYLTDDSQAIVGGERVVYLLQIVSHAIAPRDPTDLKGGEQRHETLKQTIEFLDVTHGLCRLKLLILSCSWLDGKP